MVSCMLTSELGGAKIVFMVVGVLKTLVLLAG